MGETVTVKWGVRQVLFLCVLTGISFLGNVAAPQLFAGFNYLLGSIGVVLVLRCFGPIWAVVAALVAAAWCRQLFGHYYPLFWLGLEPLFLWWWMRRRPHGFLILADLVYWPVLGIPLLCFFFLQIMHVAPIGTLAAALMYWLIGITNTLLATIVLSYTPLERLVWPGRTVQPVSLHQGLFHLLMVVILLPAIFVLVLNGRHQETEFKQKMYSSLELGARRAGYELRQQFFAAGFPARVRLTGVAPELRLKMAELLKRSLPSPQHTLTLLDGQGAVLASSSVELMARTNYSPLQGGDLRKTALADVFQRMPPNNPPIPLWQRAARSSFVRVQAVPASDMTIVSETFFAPYQKQILTSHAEALAVLLLYVGGVLSLSLWLSLRISRSLSQLSNVTTDLPSRLLTEQISWPSSRVSEIDQLIINAKQMARSLSSQFREIGQINADLESRVSQRTQELSESNQSLRQEIDERISAERQRDHLMDELTVQLRFLQTLIDAIPNPVYFKDRNGRYQGFNQAFGATLGLNREEVIGKTAEALFPAELAAFYLGKDRQLMTDGGVQQYETVLRYADGMEHTVIVNKATYHTISGDLSGIIGVFVDISQRKQAELELDRLMRELQTKNKELESIIYVSSHDLRSPLVNIQGFSRKLGKQCTELGAGLAEPGLNDDKRLALLQIAAESMPRSLGFITSSVEKMDSLLAGLLRLSRLGRAAITIENLDMNQLMSKIASSLAFQLEAAGAMVEIETLLPCQGDAVQVSQVFTNLLDNAIKYRAPERPLQVRISSQPRGAGVEYCVQDNGIGIHRDYHEQVWEIFHRINQRDVPGEGLGLTASRRILDRLNGEIRLESREGVGSSFYVWLPA